MHREPIASATSNDSSQLTRRRFLAADTFAAAAALFYGVLVTGAQNSCVPASERLRLGFIGVGGMGLATWRASS
jgi:hypothetical protein